MTILLVNAVKKLHTLTYPHFYHSREKLLGLKKLAVDDCFSPAYQLKGCLYFGKWPEQCTLICHVDKILNKFTY